MLVPFRGRCAFRMYMKNKRNKYGLKVLCFCDSKWHYLLHVFLYCREENSPNPQIIEFCNSTKGGVDGFDQKVANYSVNRRTRRLPMAIFYAMIDITGVYSSVFFTTKLCKEKFQRRDFIISLRKSLINNHISRRLSEARLPRTPSMPMENVIGKPAQAAVAPEMR
ncbi:hypothetical protein PR048_004648 [Dryococelus australis]|uniref:PiggyBac transposable element-derived protein domain-containing protein n=1 Tax=Dryococelus australis TaxID=614101 RepID=A0ABQ9I6D4_9NEOP|nr:hypothetical protein PR048_004648 [Dryococelus australis]